MTDVRVRRALALAYPSYDVVRINGAIGHVTAVPATNLVPPQTPGRTAYPTHGRRGFASRPDAAHALLRSAHALGTEIRFAFDPAVPASVRTMHAIVRALDGVGFRTRPVPVGRALLTRQATRSRRPAHDHPVRRLARRERVAAGPLPIRPTRTARARWARTSPRSHNPPSTASWPGSGAVPWSSRPRRTTGWSTWSCDRWAPEFAVSYGGVDMAHGSRVNGMSDDTILGMPTWQQLSVAR